jgi:hypothetical protein
VKVFALLTISLSKGIVIRGERLFEALFARQSPLLSKNATESHGFWEITVLLYLFGFARKSFNITKNTNALSNAQF